MADRKLGRGVATALAGFGVLLLAVAAAGDGYWQALFINLGTGVLLFVALEYALYGAAERLTALITNALHGQSDEGVLEMWNWADTLSVEAREALPHQLQAMSPLPPAELEDLERELQAVAGMHASERVKAMSGLGLLADHYGPQRLRQVITALR